MTIRPRSKQAVDRIVILAFEESRMRLSIYSRHLLRAIIHWIFRSLWRVRRGNSRFADRVTYNSRNVQGSGVMHYNTQERVEEFVRSDRMDVIRDPPKTK